MSEIRTFEEIKDRVEQVFPGGPATFYIVRHRFLDHWFLVYSEVKTNEIQLLDRNGRPVSAEHFAYHSSLEAAQQVVLTATERIEKGIERKRNGPATMKQVYFLFTHKIPIAEDLTWQEASDIIGEKINQLAYEKEQSKTAGPRRPKVEEWLAACPFRKGDQVHHAQLGNGTVLHAGIEKAGVRFEAGEQLVKVQDLTLAEH